MDVRRLESEESRVSLKSARKQIKRKEKVNRTYPILKHTFIISKSIVELHLTLSKFCKQCIIWKCLHIAVSFCNKTRRVDVANRTILILSKHVYVGYAEYKLTCITCIYAFVLRVNNDYKEPRYIEIFTLHSLYSTTVCDDLARLISQLTLLSN